MKSTMYRDITLKLLIIILLCLSVVFTKNVDHSRTKRTTTTSTTNALDSCHNVKSFFELKNITIPTTVVDGPKGKK